MGRQTKTSRKAQWPVADEIVFQEKTSPADETQIQAIEQTVSSQNLEEKETAIAEFKFRARNKFNFEENDVTHPVLKLMCYHINPEYLVDHLFRAWEEDFNTKYLDFNHKRKYSNLCRLHRSSRPVEEHEVVPVNPWASWNRKKFFSYYRSFLFIFAMLLIMAFPFLHSYETIRYRCFVLATYFSLPVIVAIFTLLSLEKDDFKLF